MAMAISEFDKEGIYTSEFTGDNEALHCLPAASSYSGHLPQIDFYQQLHQSQSSNSTRTWHKQKLKYSCQMCSYASNRSYNFVRHLVHVHSQQDLNSESSHISTKRFSSVKHSPHMLTCPQCGTVCHSLHQFKLHNRQQHNTA